MNDGWLGADDVAATFPLIESYAYNSYRDYRMIKRRARVAVLAAEVEATLRHPDGMVYLCERAGGSAAVVARRLAWDSEFFGVPMARIEYVLGSDEGARRAAVGTTLAELGALGVRHVAARVDVGNVAGAALLEDCGFRLRDALMTYVARPVKEPAREVRALGTVRFFRENDGPAVVAIAREAFRGFHSRFHADPDLPRDRADALYEEWARQCVSGAMADTIMVSEAERGLLGFLAWRRREPVSSVSGVPIFGGGLGGCRPDAPGAFAGLVHMATRWAHERGGVAECQTLNHNFAAIRVYEEVGAHYVRGEYTMHVSLRSAGS